MPCAKGGGSPCTAGTCLTQSGVAVLGLATCADGMRAAAVHSHQSKLAQTLAVGRSGFKLRQDAVCTCPPQAACRCSSCITHTYACQGQPACLYGVQGLISLARLLSCRLHIFCGQRLAPHLPNAALHPAALRRGLFILLGVCLRPHLIDCRPGQARLLMLPRLLWAAAAPCNQQLYITVLYACLVPSLEINGKAKHLGEKALFSQQLRGQACPLCWTRHTMVRRRHSTTSWPHA